MSDLISRQAALEEIQGFYPPKVPNESEAEAINRVGWECAINCIEAYLRTVKPVDPVKHGKWIKNDGRYGWHCSKCGKDDIYAFCSDSDTEGDYCQQDYYCPNCGARMDGE